MGLMPRPQYSCFKFLFYPPIMNRYSLNCAVLLQGQSRDLGFGTAPGSDFGLTLLVLCVNSIFSLEGRFMFKNRLLVFIVVVGFAVPLFGEEAAGRLFVTGVEIRGGVKSLVITGYNGGPANVIIPSSIDGVPVRKIGDRAFRLKGLTGVTLPEGLEYIGAQAFFGNKLSIVEIPTSVKEISASAFDSNMLKKVIRGGKTAVPESSYTASGSGETKVTYAEVRRERIYYVSAEKQNDDGGLIQPPEDKSNEHYNPLTGYDAAYKPVSSTYGPKTTAPKPPAESTVNLLDKTLYLPGRSLDNDNAAFEYFDSGASAGSGFSGETAAVDAFVIQAGAAESGVKNPHENGMPGEGDSFFPRPAPVDIKMDSSSGIGKFAYRNKGLDLITIPDGAKFIGDGAFSSNNLTSVVIPPSVRHIGSQAFMGNNLTSITIGENVVVQYDSFRYQFSDYYRMNNYKAGRYVLKSGHWNFEGREPGHIVLNVR
jgi:hypothetical protein